MQSLNAKVLSVLLFLLIFTINYSAFHAFDDDKEIESRVVKLLQKRDVGELANELAQNKSAASISDLLVNLSVFARAGHRPRVHETLREIGKIYLSAENKTQILRVARRAVSNDDFIAQKIFYESIAVEGDNKVMMFLDLWRTRGDGRELEDWLKIRANTGEIWWFQLAELKKSRGMANELAEELKNKVKATPEDFSLIDKYLYVISDVMHSSIGLDTVRYKQDISWLADEPVTDSAYTAYEIGRLLKIDYPSLAEKLFIKSLSQPYTEKDKKWIFYRETRYTQVPPDVKNPEKQLRFRTKQELAEIYRKTNQPQLAQTIAEELIKMDVSDIQTAYPGSITGAVQSASGQRVVELKILQDESENQDSPKYWLNRAAYYAGRGERNLVWQTFMQALDKFHYVPNNPEASYARAWILHTLNWFCDGYSEAETEEVLRREFISARSNNDTKYVYQLIWIINDDYENLMNEFFVNTDWLPKVLAERANWREDEEFVIINAMDSEKWDAEKRGNVWNQLSVLAQKDIENRAYALATAMQSNGEYKKAVVLLEKCLKVAPEESKEDDWYFDRPSVEQDLFDSYIGSGDWRKAEQLFFSGFSYWGNELGKIAVIAAKSGNINDALRLWKINANLDRRNLSEFGELSQTAVKPLLREFYLQMKKNDPLTDAPDAALKNLK